MFPSLILRINSFFEKPENHLHQPPKTHQLEQDWKVNGKAPELTRSNTDRTDITLSGTSEKEALVSS